MTESPENERARIRAWIETVLQRTGWSKHRLAVEAGLSPSTITDIFSDRKYTASSPTIAKIERATGIPLGPASGAERATGPRFSEPEAVYIAADDRSDDLANSLAVTGEQAVWRLESEALRLAGCVPGDLLVVDPAVPPQGGDIVCVQIYDLNRGDAETVFRVYDPPYVVTAAASPSARAKPRLPDGESIMIWGTVVSVVRRRNRQP